ncbi:hypothetical protein AMR47_08075 [Leptospira interrogans]|nr:hypothetical protein AMR47_08075 [Leptospira interrogans]
MKIRKIASIVHFNSTETNQKLNFLQLYYLYFITQNRCYVIGRFRIQVLILLRNTLRSHL